MKLKIGTTADLPADGQAREFMCDSRPICVARVGGQLTAMDNVCPHRGGPLSDGVVMDGKLICPWHGWQFDPVTGQSVQVPNTGVDLYRIFIDGDDVFVEK
jgi:nitrite reductase (NADH) small subunit